MNKLVKIWIAVLTLSITACTAQIKNEKTNQVKIYGNCGMCESTIEKSGNVKKIAAVDWDKDSKMATITYDSTKTNQSQILKRIALAGYDSNEFLAPDNVYASLPECCQYERAAKIVSKKETPKMEAENHANHNHEATQKQEANQLKVVLDSYFEVKDALIKTDGNTSAAKAKNLSSVINAVKMETLKTEEHAVFMKVMKNLISDAEQISKTKDISQQREFFSTLSSNMYQLIKATKPETPVYYQHCPMYNDGKGANWLSKENAIKNPYYGSQMLTCGKTVETLK